IDSRTIIDRPGAEKLIGNGDMLFLGPQNSNPIRLQSPFVKEDEVQNVVRFIRRQAESVGAYSIDEDFESDSENGVVTTARGIESVDFDDSQSTSSESEDPIYEEAKELVITAGKASTSYIQRKLRVGYSRAARLIDELEDNGIVGPAEGSKPRNILVEKEADDTQDMD
ncbi:MAG TPA: DNA translocase FtsK, partial [Candidatus Pacebacteria bacterium]|nr:DNA translocase FtsK [Candidatus Paceibacterota bacterium]